MRKLFIVLMLLLSCGVCNAHAVTDMSIGKFAHKFADAIGPASNYEIKVSKIRYFAKLNGQDVYKMFFTSNVEARMYICVKDQEILHVLFINDLYNEEATRQTAINFTTAMKLLGLTNANDLASQVVQKNDGRIYVFSNQENRTLLIAADNDEKELKFHIVGDDYIWTGGQN